MTGKLQPLAQNFQIVDPATGRPTDYFIRWAQQRQLDIGTAIDAEQAAEIIAQYLADHPLQAGTGIGLSPSGNLSDSPTISADVQDILDTISTTQGSILYRGAADWQALAPGTLGHVLQTGGAGADPSWVAQSGGGGGGSWILDRIVVPPAGVTAFDILNLDFTDALLVFRNISLSASALFEILVSLNNGSSWKVTDYFSVNTTTGVEASVSTLMRPNASATAGARSAVVKVEGNGQGGPVVATVLTAAVTAVSTKLFTDVSAPINALRIQSSSAATFQNVGEIFVYLR